MGITMRDMKEMPAQLQGAVSRQPRAMVRLTPSEMFAFSGERALQEAVKTPLPEGMDPPTWWVLGGKQELLQPEDATEAHFHELEEREKHNRLVSIYRKRIVFELSFARQTNTRTMGLWPCPTPLGQKRYSDVATFRPSCKSTLKKSEGGGAESTDQAALRRASTIPHRRQYLQSLV